MTEKETAVVRAASALVKYERELSTLLDTPHPNDDPNALPEFVELVRAVNDLERSQAA